MGWSEYPEEIRDLLPEPDPRRCPECGESKPHRAAVCQDCDRACPECGEPTGPDGWCPDCGDGLIPGDEEVDG